MTERILKKVYEQESQKGFHRKIYGLGYTKIAKLRGMLGLNPNKNMRLKNQDKRLIRKREFLFTVVTEIPLEFILKRQILVRICLLWKYHTYRGIRHLQHLPVRGQRTHGNANTQYHLHVAGKSFPFNLRKGGKKFEFANRSKKFKKKFNNSKQAVKKTTAKKKPKLKPKKKNKNK